MAILCHELIILLSHACKALVYVSLNLGNSAQGILARKVTTSTRHVASPPLLRSMWTAVTFY
eukprot:1590730-Amphidinium_carterae.1